MFGLYENEGITVTGVDDVQELQKSVMNQCEQMELMSVIREGKPTLAAELLFGLYPQAFFPQLGIIAISVPGTEIGDTDIDGSRFIDN